MRIHDYLPLTLVNANLTGTQPTSVLTELSQMIADSNEELDATRVLTVLEERERLGSTGIGNGIAIPHSKLPGLRSVILAVGRSAAGIDFDSMDGELTHIFFVIVAPEDSVGVHLSLLARISALAEDEDVCKAMIRSKSDEDLRNTIIEADERNGD
ncbi:MAG: PTS sugar transporter subunit IIA [Deltaproteobacteria bacterium]|nr:PTS sugar transporter subunit IIA [Deltaproteobacteria bacterium]MCB9478787.1 PTS sugar transporter subunit IIA [Deltaproteobacteria bacterium]MCB9489051.1 PTS sugar transporter subunit IIA [Deltaproteobacteria bacterium]